MRGSFPIHQQRFLRASPSGDISVETQQGEVQLSGTVAGAGDIQKASALAFGVTGVKKVQNNLKSK